ncbi:MAG: tRNA epoxyqueuosine(34) reductase QueG [Planctomycetota bacterium]|nr:tRNA epoxyqueuosine(34) reductase QueG [Planctomycetota bacterium]
MDRHADLTAAVKRLADDAGFARVGIAPAGKLPHSERFKRWFDRGMQAEMHYLRRNVEKRFRPELLLAGARSVICLATGYMPAEPSRPALIARYARGRDYHKLLKARCRALMDEIRRVFPAFEGRAFVDTGPVAERSLAAAAGLGWIGRNGCLIVPGMGSYVLLCEIVCNLPLHADEPLAGLCGDCDTCLQACPTGAVRGDSLIDARRCASYLTIEHRGEIDPELQAKMPFTVFGCDVCQEVCPFNQAPSIPPGDPALTTPSALALQTLPQILAWRRADWDAATRGSTCRRASYEMFIRNATIAADANPV